MEDDHPLLEPGGQGISRPNVGSCQRQYVLPGSPKSYILIACNPMPIFR
jgi:hypothetical protein